MVYKSLKKAYGFAMNILAIGFTQAVFFQENLKSEVDKRGYSLDFCSASSLRVDAQNGSVEVSAGNLDLTKYDVIHVGAIAANRWSTIATLGYLHRTTGCQIIDKRLIESTLDEYSGLYKYFLESEHDIHLPRSVTFKTVDQIEDKLSEFVFPVIVKTNSSKQGKGVGIAYSSDDLRAFVKSKDVDKNKSGYILRERIPNDGDYRVNVIDGEVVLCLKRTPAEGEFRSNISLGGTLTYVPIEEVQEVCDVAKKIVELSNYDIAGVDVMVHEETGVPYVLEVNRAPSGLEDDVRVSGVDLASMIVDLYEKRVQEK